MSSKLESYLAAVVLGLLVGLGVGWKLWRPSPPKAEGPAIAVRQSDGSRILERKPDPHAKPAQEIPKGSKVERVIQVEVKPNPLPPIPTVAPGTPGSGVVPPAPPVTVDLSLVRMPDLSRRVIASSPDGEVVGGLDVPVEAPAPQAKPIRWSASGLAGFDAFQRRTVYGAAVNYQRGPFIFTGGAIGQTAFVGAGIRW